MSIIAASARSFWRAPPMMGVNQPTAFACLRGFASAMAAGTNHWFWHRRQIREYSCLPIGKRTVRPRGEVSQGPGSVAPEAIGRDGERVRRPSLHFADGSARAVGGTGGRVAMQSVIEIDRPAEAVYGFFLDLERSIVSTDPKVE